MAIAHVQTPANGVSNSSATSVALAFGSNVTAGNAILGGWRYSVGGRTVTLSDTLGNTYTSNAVEAIVASDSNSTNGIGFALNITGGACTVTFAISGAALNLRFSTSEYSALAASSALDQVVSATGVSTTPSAGSVTPSTDGQLFYACFHLAEFNTYTAGADFTINTTVSDASGQRLMTERFIQTTAASHAGNCSIVDSKVWGATVATFKEAVAGHPAVKRMGGVQHVHRIGGGNMRPAIRIW